MQPDLEQVATGLLPSLVTAVVTAWLTVRWSLRRFYSEQWWGRKAQSYVEILNALYKVKAYLAGRVRDQMSAEVMTEEQRQQLLERAREGCDEISKAASIGTLFVSPEARECLEKLMPVLYSCTLPDSYDCLESVETAINDCISSLCPIAKSDLKVS